jgi:thioredoxin-dependent peroxiredoxin
MRAISIVLLTLAVGGGCKKSQQMPEENLASAAPAAPASVAPVSAPAPALLAVGAPVPAIESLAHNGQKVNLAELKGRPVVVYFYPKDDTPGCTIEAEEIRDDWADLSKANAVVLGVSTQDNASHRAFASKYGLPFMLLPDSDEAIAKAFGVPVKNGYTKRVTFVIDKQGKIAKVFPNVNPKGHSDEILEALRSLG